jgi:hypothetical protein
LLRRRILPVRTPDGPWIWRAVYRAALTDHLA